MINFLHARRGIRGFVFVTLFALGCSGGEAGETSENPSVDGATTGNPSDDASETGTPVMSVVTSGHGGNTRTNTVHALPDWHGGEVTDTKCYESTLFSLETAGGNLFGVANECPGGRACDGSPGQVVELSITENGKFTANNLMNFADGSQAPSGVTVVPKNSQRFVGLLDRSALVVFDDGGGT